MSLGRYQSALTDKSNLVRGQQCWISLLRGEWTFRESRGLLENITIEKLLFVFAGFSTSDEKWKEGYVQSLLDRLELIGDSQRVQAARSLLYVMQGTFIFLVVVC